ncbi:FHA domain protein (macronuclear) [Tetrahymena thermophila SB210]|uniref:FHA domain protein n=1 Tax=Tetrahymena thermophila (strain SB210) TaxID=312017 RepID=Q23FB8_TETTS|nr:FHA domain protein [Tetrahymena thermophila SB210]EAR95235.2 FHA domain protein [Tetrahymena thermophila SB210]|eukprot:XP_001015480.2 FHA domain protein [Tetrahymena thermophila SB210]
MFQQHFHLQQPRITQNEYKIFNQEQIEQYMPLIQNQTYRNQENNQQEYDQLQTANQVDVQNLPRNHQLLLQAIKEEIEENIYGTKVINALLPSAEKKNLQDIEEEDDDEQIIQNKIEEELKIIGDEQDNSNNYDDDLQNTFENQNCMLFRDDGFGQHQVLGLVHEANDIDEDQNDNDIDIQNEEIQLQKINKKGYGMQLSVEEDKIKERDFQKYQKQRRLLKIDEYINNQQQMSSQLEKGFINTNSFKVSVLDTFYQDDILFEKVIKNGSISSQPTKINCEDIIIGRGNQKNTKIDININRDSQVSKQHCKLVTEYYYKQNNSQLEGLDLLINYYEQIYKKNKDKIDIQTRALTLPQIQYTLKKFLYQKPSLYLVDLSSSNGSQILIDYQKYTRLGYDQFLQCGSINLHVLEINDLKHYDNFLSLISDYLLEELQREMSHEQQTFSKCGLPQKYLNFVIESFKQISALLKKINLYQTIQKQGLTEIYRFWILKFLNAKLKKREAFEIKMIPYIKIKAQQYLKQDRPKNYFLFHDEENPKIFKVGKSVECDVQLDSNLISRNHCEINYNPQTSQWLIRDGFQQDKERKPSKNKTWINLYNCKQSEYSETIPFRLEPDQESVIKLGNTIIKINKEEEHFEYHNQQQQNKLFI